MNTAIIRKRGHGVHGRDVKHILIRIDFWKRNR